MRNCQKSQIHLSTWHHGSFVSFYKCQSFVINDSLLNTTYQLHSFLLETVVGYDVSPQSRIYFQNF